mmetsp:Transcript_22599/g.57869  ORF Transcript_22599/g.57869 Transcript_22599/m.57869 type:complete len:249 (+) Transcript_22599:434-1180(+)
MSTTVVPSAATSGFLPPRGSVSSASSALAGRRQRSASPRKMSSSSSAVSSHADPSSPQAITTGRAPSSLSALTLRTESAMMMRLAPVRSSLRVVTSCGWLAVLHSMSAHQGTKGIPGCSMSTCATSSTTTSTAAPSERYAMGRPWNAHSDADTCPAVTHLMPLSLPSFSLAPSSSMTIVTTGPVPTPTVVPSCTYVSTKYLASDRATPPSSGSAAASSAAAEATTVSVGWETGPLIPLRWTAKVLCAT